MTALNVSTDASTSKWQGFWGNTSGSLQLGDGTDIFYNWTGATFQAVYATPGLNLDFATISAIASQAAREGKDTDYGFNSGEADSINRTMAGAACNAGTYLTSTSGVTPYNSTGQPSAWSTCIGEDAGGAVEDTVFGTNIVQAGSDGYNNQNVQFQIMVPVNDTNQDYYFFLEI